MAGHTPARVGVLATSPAKARQREVFGWPGAALSFPCASAGTGARCWLLTPECGLQQIPSLQVQVREGGR